MAFIIKLDPVTGFYEQHDIVEEDETEEPMVYDLGVEDIVLPEKPPVKRRSHRRKG